jgi:hypothetical protein
MTVNTPPKGVEQNMNTDLLDRYEALCKRERAGVKLCPKNLESRVDAVLEACERLGVLVVDGMVQFGK